MKILFIGGTGNISMAISRELIAQGHELWLLNRSGPLSTLSGAHYLQADIHSAEVAEVLQGHEWDAVVNWILFTAAEAHRDVRLFAGKTAQYIFISSASCYQNPGPSLYITEQTPLDNPYWQYSRDKIAAENVFAAAHAEQGFPATVVRPSHTYSTVIPLSIGGDDAYTAVARMKRGQPVVVHGDGTSLWTVTHADDFARGFIGLVGLPTAIGEAYHITSDEALSWNEIYQLTAQAVGCNADIVHVTSDTICTIAPELTGTLLGDKSPSALFDNRKIKAAVPNFKAVIPYAEGIKRTIEWFEADPARQYVDPQIDALIEQLVQLARVQTT